MTWPNFCIYYNVEHFPSASLHYSEITFKKDLIMTSTPELLANEIKIRQRPELKSILRNITEMTITTGIWVIWSYLLLPIINLVLWLFGVGVVYVEFERASYNGLILLLERLGWVVLVVFAILQLWGYYNYHRFGKKNRRKERPFDATAELARFFEMTPEQVVAIQSRKESVIGLLKN